MQRLSIINRIPSRHSCDWHLQVNALSHSLTECRSMTLGPSLRKRPSDYRLGPEFVALSKQSTVSRARGVKRANGRKATSVLNTPSGDWSSL